MNTLNRDKKREGKARWTALLFVVAVSTLLVLLVRAQTDSDQDGMSDEYETFFGLNPNDGGDAALDCDNDTLNNLQEFALGSDPFESDTDGDGFPDNVDSNPVSRAWIPWGDALFVYSNEVRYVWPPWLKKAWQEDGEWLTNPAVWHVPASATDDVGRLHIELDRGQLTNDLVLALGYLDASNASLYLDLYDTNSTAVASNLFGNLLTGGGTDALSTLSIPLATYTQAASVTLRRGTGEVTVYNSLLFVDQDGDGLDADQEAQLGTSDLSADSDGDGYGDALEKLTYGTNPADSNSYPAATLSGYVSYSGLQTGLVHVIAATNADNWSAEHATAIAAPGAFSIAGVPLLRPYWIKAWRDHGGDGSNDFWEARGAYAGNPLTPTGEVYGLSIELSDPDSDGDGISDWLEITFGGDPFASNAVTTLPFVEMFETNTVVEGAVNGQNGWIASPTNMVVVQPDMVYEGVQALGFTNCVETNASVRRFFAAATNETPVWLDFHVKATRSQPYTSAPPSAVTFLFDSSGRFAAYDGAAAGTNKWVVATNFPPYASTNWVRVSIKLDYGAQTWLVALDGLLAGHDLGFAVPSDRLAVFRALGRRGFVDAMTISTNQPDGLSLDGDTLPDGWEERYFQNLDQIDTGDPDDDGLNNLGEYQHETDPTNPDTDGDGVSDGVEVFLGRDPAVSNSFQTLPFTELFETNTVQPGDIGGQNGWEAWPSNSAFVQADMVYSGAQAMALCGSATSTVRHIFAAPTNAVWVDYRARAARRLMPQGAPDDAAALCFDRNGRLVVYDGLQAGSNKWITLTNRAPVAATNWARITMRLDYATRTWLVGLDGTFAATNLGFAAAWRKFTAFGLSGKTGVIDNLTISTNCPGDLDMDGDTLPDWWEYKYFEGLERNGAGDWDQDGLTDAQEYQYGTHPKAADSDQDGLSDSDEVNVRHTNPTLADTDGDGLGDGDEIGVWHTNPLIADTDGDGAADGWEVSCGTDPNNNNSFPATISGAIVYGGGQTGAIHVVAVTDSNEWTSAWNATLSGTGDYAITTAPTLTNYWIKAWRDSNGNGSNDSWEAFGVSVSGPIYLTNNTNGADITLIDPDADGDGMPNWWELKHFGGVTNAVATDDPDGDGYLNIYEYLHGGDPTNAASIPMATRYVSLVGSNTAPYASWDTAARTIQDALDAATNAYEIVAVADGVYTGELNRGLTFSSWPVTLISTGGVAGCIIDCMASNRAVRFAEQQTRATVFANITITNGYFPGDYYDAGAAVLCTEASSPTIFGCAVVGCNADLGYGKGVSAQYGSAPRIENCIFMNNSGFGGAIDVYYGASPEIENCLLMNNTGPCGAIYVCAADARIVNCTIVFNDSGLEDAGVAVDSYQYCAPEEPPTSILLENCIVWGNSPRQIGIRNDLGPVASSVSYCDVQGGWEGEGNLNSDPLFVGGFARLSSLSPCIDAGVANGLTSDRDGRPRADDPNHENGASIWDIGADEFVDADGDGASDGWEREVGTDPNDPASFLVNVWGTVGYTGIQTGLVHVVAVTDSNNWTSGLTSQLAGTGSYMIANLPPMTNYWLKAWRDSNSNGAPDYWEAQGEAAGSPLWLTADLTGVDIVLADPPTDADNDGIPDWWEMLHFGSTNEPGSGAGGDYDQDGLNNADEYAQGTDPKNGDTDGDGMPDGWEVVHNLNPVDPADAVEDADGDGYLNIYEYVRGGDPTSRASGPWTNLCLRVDPADTNSFQTIQAALNAATNAYDIVLVADGVYAGDGNCALMFPTNPVMLTSTGGAEVCVIDCGSTNRGLNFCAGQDRRSVVRGLTIRNGYGQYGGGVDCSGSSPTILDCIILRNRTEPAYGGGGVSSRSGANPRLVNCTLVGNSTDNEGGAVLVGQSDNEQASIELIHCTVIGNHAAQGGGAYLYPVASCRIVNSILWGNDAEQLLPVDADGVTHSVVMGGYPGEGNLSDDPLLLPPLFWLKPQSPCIGNGTVIAGFPTDRDGEVRDVAHPDIGADEWNAHTNELYDLWGTNETSDTKFSADRGFYDASITVTVRTDTAGATIYYTTDGSTPTLANAITSASPAEIVVTNTTVLRALAYKHGQKPTNVDAETYIFTQDVLMQSDNPEGLPSQWGAEGWAVAADYGMDPDIVNDLACSNLMAGALKSIPTLSVAMDAKDLFGPNGIYDRDNRDDEDYERPGSVELIYPNGRKGHHENCAIKPHSYFGEPGDQPGIEGANLKRSLTLKFKKEYGSGKWEHPFFESAPENAATAAWEFDRIVLRAGSQDSWAGGRFAMERQWNTNVRDQWGRDTQIAMSGRGSHGTFVHLYLNGMYWGIYNPCERPDASFMAAYEGGSNEDWYAGNHNGDISGSPSVWTNLLAACDDSGTDWGTAQAYSNVQALLNVTNFCDYVLLWWYCGGGDWAEFNGDNNYYVVNRTNPSGPINYFCWDMEISWMPSYWANDGAWVKPSFLDPAANSTAYSRIRGVFRPLWRNAEFRQLFADRLYKHCFHGGALDDVASQARWMRLCNFIDEAMLCESARWGDAKDSAHPLKRDQHWYPARDYVFRCMADNQKRLVIACRESAIDGWPLYPSLDPPEFSTQGGTFDGSTNVTMQSTGGDIYYTTDGSDPRAAGGGTNATASLYVAPVAIGSSTTVKARALSGNVWSALNEAAFLDAAPTGGVRITEIMYDPPGSNDYEYLELKNTGPVAVNLAGWFLTNGVSCTFGATNLQPGQFAVVVGKTTAFTSRYPQVSYLRDFKKHLGNSDTVELRNATGALVCSVTYSNQAPWPEDPSGESGFSLVAINAEGDLNNPANWRASASLYGSPGQDDVFCRAPSNSPPAVSAGGPRLSITNSAITLHGNVQEGSPGAAGTGNWSTVSGPGTVTFEPSSNAWDATATFSTAGVYALQFNAGDGSLTNSAMCVAIVAPSPPISNMVFWLRSDSGVSAADGVASNWADRTSNGHDAIQSEASNCPAYAPSVFKGQPALRFDGTDDVLFVTSDAALDSGDVYTDRMVAVTFRTGDDIASPQVLYEQGGTNSGLNLHVKDGYLFMGAWSGTNWGPAWVSNAVARGAQYTAELILEGESGQLTGVVNGQTVGISSAAGLLEGCLDDGVGIGGVQGTTCFADGTAGTQGTNSFGGWLSEVILLGAREDLVDYQKVWGGAGTVGTSERGVGPGVEAQGDRGWAGGAWGGATGSGGQVPAKPPTNYDTSCSVELKWWYTNQAVAGPVTPIALNIDDDNTNDTADMSETAAVSGEKSLAPLTMILDSSSVNVGKLTLSCETGAEAVVVWENKERGAPGQKVTLPQSWDLRQPSFGQTFQVKDNKWVSKTPYYWVECTNRATLARFRLTYTYPGICKSNDAIALPVALIPDFNHDRTNDETDVAQMSTTNGPFRFWINDDDDDGDEAGKPSKHSDYPGHTAGWFGSADYDNSKVDGRCDLLDFFPLWLDLNKVLQSFPPDDPNVTYEYKLSQVKSAVRVVYTDLAKEQAGSYLVQTVSNCGSSFSKEAREADTLEITSSGVKLKTEFLNKIKGDATKGILMVEGAHSTTNPLTLEIWKDSRKFFQAEMRLSVSSVTNMYRTVNLRGMTNPGALPAPSNNPDALSNGRNLVFLHGYEPGSDTKWPTEWLSDMFKRFYQSGSKAKFHGVSWDSSGTSTKTFYQKAVTNAFCTAPVLKAYVAALTGEVTVAAHSLGNMVASSAIADHSMSVANYMLCDAAVASEAYDSTMAEDSQMINDWWTSYPTNSYAAKWHELFTTGDSRADLKWPDRFKSVLTNGVQLCNFYSDGDEVFELTPSVGLLSGLYGGAWTLKFFIIPVPVVTPSRHTWQKQEVFKGTGCVSGLLAFGSTEYAGWGFEGSVVRDPATGEHTVQPAYSATDASNATSSVLCTNPVFTHYPSWLVGTNSLSQTNINEMLGMGIPALTPATGRTNVTAFGAASQFNLNNGASGASTVFQANFADWPSRARPDLKNWLHCDMKDVAYFFNYPLYDKIVTDGGLK